MFAIRPVWSCWAAFARIDKALIEPEFARLGFAQPMRQASTAIHREITVATPALKVRNGERIVYRQCVAIPKDNLFCEARAACLTLSASASREAWA